MMKRANIGELDYHAVELLEFVFPFTVGQEFYHVRMV